MHNRCWGSDRRRFQRLKVNLSVWYRVDNPLFVRNAVGDREIEAVTLDLSEKGMAISTKYNIPAWATLIIKLILFKTDRNGLVSFKDPVEILGEVCSNNLLENNEYRLGIRFKEINVSGESGISHFVTSAISQQ
jgi:c-di-GMP-binding flagellar brake protein YcgR